MTTRVSALGSDEVFVPHNLALTTALGSDMTYKNHNLAFVSALGADIVFKTFDHPPSCRTQIIG